MDNTALSQLPLVGDRNVSPLPHFQAELRLIRTQAWNSPDRETAIDDGRTGDKIGSSGCQKNRGPG